jgi:VWFA-related protein
MMVFSQPRKRDCLGIGIRLALCLCLGFTALPRSVSLAQAPPQQPKPGEFGSSLERLKWDPDKQRTRLTRDERAKENGSNVDEILRIDTSLVVSDALVLDQRGFAVRGLNRDDFLVTEEKQPQEIEVFTLGDGANLPRSIVLIIDYSSSQAPFIDNSIDAAKTLVDQLNARDRMAIVTDDVELIADFTGDKRVLKDKLDFLKKKVSLGAKSGAKPFGRSKQYSALLATLLEKFSRDLIRPIIIFQTDGDELGRLRDSKEPEPPPRVKPEVWIKAQKARRASLTEFGLADVYRAVENSHATIYTVIPGLRLVAQTPAEHQEKLKVLSERMKGSLKLTRSPKLSEARFKMIVEHMQPMQLALMGLSQLSGGWTEFLEEPSQAAGIYSRIFSDINQRYVIGYYPTNKEHDGKRRTVKIEVRGRPQYTVVGRKSYYAPEPR